MVVGMDRTYESVRSSGGVVRPRTVPINCAADVGTAAMAGYTVGQRLGLESSDQRRLATAISELASNVVRHAGRGSCTITDESDELTARARVVVQDSGPGIEKMDLAMSDGYSTRGTLGLGLPGARRLVDDFNIVSRPGRTKIVFSVERRKP
jgi:serine/threonine-protein kinase RsbT